MIWVYYLVGVVVLVVVVIVVVVVVVVIIVVFLATVTTRYCTTVENTHTHTINPPLPSCHLQQPKKKRASVQVRLHWLEARPLMICTLGLRSCWMLNDALLEKNGGACLVSYLVSMRGEKDIYGS